MKILTDIKFGGTHEGQFHLLAKQVVIEEGKGIVALKIDDTRVIIVSVNPDNPREIVAHVRDKNGQVVMLPIGDMEDK